MRYAAASGFWSRCATTLATRTSQTDPCSRKSNQSTGRVSWPRDRSTSFSHTWGGLNGARPSVRTAAITTSHGSLTSQAITVGPSEDLPVEPERCGPVVALVGAGAGGGEVFRVDVQKDVASIHVQEERMRELDVDAGSGVGAPLVLVDRARDVSAPVQLQGVERASPEDVEAEARVLQGIQHGRELH